jgi:hypothetical protein
MDAARRTLVAAFAAVLIPSSVGCQMFENMMYELQPHRLRRLNSGPGMSSDAYYSVQDPVGAESAAASTMPLHEIQAQADGLSSE